MASEELLESPPIDVSPQQAAEVLDRLYGIAGEVFSLPGERDRNFRVVAKSGTFNLKAANPAERVTVLDMQQRALVHIRNWGPKLPVAEPIPTLRGDLAATVSLNGREVPVRLTTFLDGETVDEVGFSPALGRHTMETLGRLDRALRTFSHRELTRPLLWNLEQVLDLRLHSEFLREDQRRVADSWLRHFEASVKPRLGGMHRQPLHGDFNPANLIVDPTEPERLAGVIDFGDMTIGPRAIDVSVAAAYQCLNQEHPIDALAAAAAGYHAIAPLDPDEASLIADLAITRLVQSLLISAWRSELHPENRDYILIHATPVWKALWKLVNADLYEVRERIASACVGGAGAEPEIDVSLERRRSRLGPGLRLTYDRPLQASSANGVWITDTAGVRHLDAYNNVAHVGHGNRDVVSALAAQAARLSTNTRYLVDEVTAYADRIVGLLPDPLEVIYFTNSGSEANDLAWRIARTVTRRRGMAVTEHAYHGSTYLTMATSPEELGIENLEPWVATVPAPHPGAGGSAAIAAAVDRLAAGGEAIAAYACDTVFSSDGILEPPKGYLAAVYKSVRLAGGLCIADEVQAGFGRVGARMWGFAGSDVVPDIVTLGKPMGNGHPLAAVVTTAAIAEEFSRLGYFFSTFGGNPVSAAVGAAVLDVMEREGLPEHADRIGEHLRRGLRDLADRYPVIADVRGPGLFIGVEVSAPDGSAAELAHRIQNEMRNRQVLIGRTGPLGNVLKIRPPLVFTKKHANQLLATLAVVLADL